VHLFQPFARLHAMTISLDQTVNPTGSHSIHKIADILQNQNEKSRHIKDFIYQIKIGELDKPLSSSYENDEIITSLDEMRNSIKGTIEGINTTVAKAVTEGKLNTRLETTNQTGLWKEMSDRVNRLLNSFSDPLNELNGIIVAMAEGDLTRRYSSDAKGDIAQMAESFNAALDNVDGLLNQVSKNATLIEETVSEMKVSSIEMATSTQEIATSIAQMSNGAQNQVNRIDESSNLIEEMLNSSNNMENLASEIYTSAQKGVETSNAGKVMLTSLERGIESISEVGQKTSQSFQTLSARSNDISQVLSVMNEIATQTNLLALNAAIEAAQAGDAGRGFAIVAEEIRKLAEDSKRSSHEIESLIKAIQHDTMEATNAMNEMSISVKEGEQIAKDASTSFEEIFHTLEINLEHSEKISSSAKAQSEDIRKVVGITESIVVIAEETAAGSEEVAASASQLSAGMESYNQRVESLNSIAENFKEGVSMLNISNNENTVIFKMKEAYEKEKALLDSLLNYMPDFIYFKDLQSRFMRVSKSMISLFNVQSTDEIHGKSDFDFFGDHAQKAYDDEQKIIATGTPLLNDVEKEDRNDGTEGYVSTNKLPLVDANNQVIGTFGISRDITEQKHTEIELSLKASKLDECMKEKKRLSELLPHT